MDNLTPKYKKFVKNNYNLKIDPRLFDQFKGEKVPVIILAICKGTTPKKETCEFKYTMRGAISLEYFFEKIADLEPRYKKYHEYLIGNKIVYDNQKEEL